VVLNKVNSIDELIKPTRFKIAGVDPKYGKEGVQPYVNEALNEIPNSYNPTISSLTRLEGHSAGTGEHKMGEAVDFSDTKEANNLFNWVINTQEGQSWKRKYGVKILYHGDADKSGNHYHFRFGDFN